MVLAPVWDLATKRVESSHVCARTTCRSLWQTSTRMRCARFVRSRLRSPRIPRWCRLVWGNVCQRTFANDEQSMSQTPNNQIYSNVKKKHRFKEKHTLKWISNLEKMLIFWKGYLIEPKNRERDRQATDSSRSWYTVARETRSRQTWTRVCSWLR